jgi:formamidopyrimidine-DNA glycosylase
VPELPEVQAHVERLSERFTGNVLAEFRPLSFTALKTASPVPDLALGQALRGFDRRGKYLLADFGELTFIVHLMQGGRLKDDLKKGAKPKTAQARWTFADERELVLTEAGTERKAGVWCALTDGRLDRSPLDRLGPEALTLSADELAERFATRNMRIHAFLRDQGCIAGLGRLLANEVCHRAKLSPFSMTGKLGVDGARRVRDAIHETVDEGLAFERRQKSMSSSEERPAATHNRKGEACPVCSDTIREVKYSSYKVNYCATCQTNGKPLADNTTSKFLK